MENKKRVHKARREHEHKRANKTALQIRADKCQASKARQEARRAERRAQANARVEAWRSLSPQQKLKTLDNRLGKGLGAVRQRERIAQELQND